MTRCNTCFSNVTQTCHFLYIFADPVVDHIPAQLILELPVSLEPVRVLLDLETDVKNNILAVGLGKSSRKDLLHQALHTECFSYHDQLIRRETFLEEFVRWLLHDPPERVQCPEIDLETFRKVEIELIHLHVAIPGQSG